MPDTTEPAIARRRLARELREARKSAVPPPGKKVMSQSVVAAEMNWHPSKLLRIEQAKTPISKNDLHRLLAFYGLLHRFDDLWSGVSSRHRSTRWKNYRDLFSPEFMRYLEYEEDAQIIREFQPLIIPALLQTERYARAMIERFAGPDDDQSRQTRSLEVRMARQQLWAANHKCHLFFLLDHAVISRWVGGPDVMRAQLEKLKAFNQDDIVTVRVIPFSEDIHAGLAGAYTLLDFEGANGRILYLDEAQRSISVDDPDVIDPYVKRITDLAAVAASTVGTDALIDVEIAKIDERASR